MWREREREKKKKKPAGIRREPLFEKSAFVCVKVSKRVCVSDVRPQAENRERPAVFPQQQSDLLIVRVRVQRLVIFLVLHLVLRQLSALLPVGRLGGAGLRSALLPPLGTAVLEPNLKEELGHACSLRCLGLLTFHRTTVGSHVRLSQGATLAERTRSTFQHGLVFSSRPVRVKEKVCLRVTGSVPNWHGGLRVGFTTVPPAGRTLPPRAIPDLTETPGHWAAVVPDAYCRDGSRLEVWVTRGGNVYIQNKNGRALKLLEGLDLSRPLWAMIDIYGQTCSVLLQGSKKADLVGTRRSCPVPLSWTQRLPSFCCDCDQVSSSISSVCHSDKERYSCKNNHSSFPANRQELDWDSSEDCAVCLSKKTQVTLLCGHRCLCFQCSVRVLQEFGTCPLCRQDI